MSIEKLIGRMPTDQKRGWKVEVLGCDGQTITEVEEIRLSHPEFCIILYGRMSGTDTDRLFIHENGGGGAVVIPYVWIGGRLFVGSLLQHRANMGGQVVCAIGGFRNQNETHREAADREYLQESRLPSGAFVELPNPGNPNRAYFVTDEDGEGIHFYALQIPEEYLIPQGGDAYGINADFLKVSTEDTEQIEGAIMVPVCVAATSADMLLNAAVSRLLSYLQLI